MTDTQKIDSIEGIYRRALVDGGFIAPVGYGKGFPIVRSWGLRVFGRLVDLFVEKVAQPETLDVTEPPPLLEAGEYEAEVADFGGFDSVYRMRLSGRNLVLRPDAAMFNIRHLMECYERRGPTQTIAWFQGFRSVRGATPSLFRDRFINPFVQYNRLVPSNQADLAIVDVTDRLVAFFDALCVPVRMVDLGAWKRYANDLRIAVAHMPDGRPTIAAMFYVVGNSYRRQGNVPESMTVFDVGITEKVFALVALRHIDSVGIRLPSALAPVQIVTSQKARTSLEPDLIRRRRIETQPVLEDRDIRVWARRGVPLLVDVGSRGLRVRGRTSGWRDVAEAGFLDAVLAEEDEHLWSGCIAVDIENAAPEFNRQPDPQSDYHPVVAASSRLAASLGRPVADVFSNDGRAFY